MKTAPYDELLNTISQKKAFIWDFDGCLADTEPLHHRAYDGAFAAYECWLNLDKNQYNHDFTHTGGGVEKQIEKFKLNFDSEYIYTLKSFIYRHLIKTVGAKLFAENFHVLDIMKRLGAQIAIASNSSLEEILPIIEASGTQNCFDTVIGKTAGLRKKPFPDIFLSALDTLGIGPKDALVFEDSERGLEAAAKAGIEAIWIKTESNKLEKTNQTYLAEWTHNELLEFFEKIRKK